MEDDGESADGTSPEWRFLIDENFDPAIAAQLRQHDTAAVSVLGALFEGADDFDDILPSVVRRPRCSSPTTCGISTRRISCLTTTQVA